MRMTTRSCRVQPRGLVRIFLVREMEFVIKSILNASPNPEKLCSDQTVIPPPPAEWECSPWVLGALMWPWRWVEVLFIFPTPKVLRVWLTGQLSDWVSAKDIILEILRILTVKGGVGKIIEYAGPGVKTLTVPERSTITNMGAELGASSSIFPSDEQTLRFLEAQGRAQDWVSLTADEDATYDEELAIDLSLLVPMVAQPHSPDNVVPVSDQ